MTGLMGEKAYFTRSQILASKDMWEMNAAHLVLRLNKCFFSLCVCVCVRDCVFLWMCFLEAPPMALPPNYSDLRTK